LGYLSGADEAAERTSAAACILADDLTTPLHIFLEQKTMPSAW
jgi:hypothetical protein